MADSIIHTLTWTDEDFIKAAHKWRRELLYMPVLALQDSTKFMTGFPDCRTNQHLGSVEATSQLSRYYANKRGDGKTTLTWREMEMAFLACNQDFIPNDYIQTIFGEHAPKLGIEMRNAEAARIVMAAILKSIGSAMNMALFNAEYTDGTDPSTIFETAKSFNGFNTVAQKDIDAGNISTDNGNLTKLSETPSSQNFVDLIKGVLFSLPTELRMQETFLFCPPEWLDYYNESYLLTHPAVPYNTKYEQAYVEGSYRKMTFAPMPGLAGEKFAYIAPKMNMVYGYDLSNDMSNVEVGKYDVDTLTLSLKMFFGVQFRTVDKRYLHVLTFGDSSSNSAITPDSADNTNTDTND